MTSSAGPVVVTTAANSAFLPGLITALRSARSALPSTTELFAYLMLADVADADVSRIRATVATWPNTSIEIRDPTPLLPERLPRTARYSNMTYARLCLPELVDESHPRVIYLDADVLVRRALQDLWTTDLRGKTFGAGRDFFFPYAVDGLPDTHASHGLAADAPYFNAGVLLLDLARWRSLEVSSRILQYTLDNWDTVRYADQDGLNAVMGDEILELDPRWNIQVGSLHDLRHRKGADFLVDRPENEWQRRLVAQHGSFLRTGRIWHFVGGKPWTGNALRLGRTCLLAQAEFVVHGARSGYFTPRETGRLGVAAVSGLRTRVKRHLPTPGWR